MIFLEFRYFLEFQKHRKCRFQPTPLRGRPRIATVSPEKKTAAVHASWENSDRFFENSKIYFRILMKMFFFLEFSGFLEFLESLQIFHTEVLRVGGPGSPLSTQGSRHSSHNNSPDEKYKFEFFSKIFFRIDHFFRMAILVILKF